MRIIGVKTEKKTEKKGSQKKSCTPSISMLLLKQAPKIGIEKIMASEKSAGKEVHGRVIPAKIETYGTGTPVLDKPRTAPIKNLR